VDFGILACLAKRPPPSFKQAPHNKGANTCQRMSDWDNSMAFSNFLGFLLGFLWHFMNIKNLLFAA